MNTNETDDLFDPDAALLASEADWDLYLNDRDLYPEGPEEASEEEGSK